MKYDRYGNTIYQETDIFSMIYKNSLNFSKIIVEDTKNIHDFKEHSSLEFLFEQPNDQSIEEFDKNNQNIWFLPSEYDSFDIYKYCLDASSTEEQQIRCMEELVLFESLNMIPVLTMLKYIVDTLRKNNIVWGVGRGSSVSSYVLFLLGIHKIDSIKYNLDYTEFLRTGE